MAPSVLLLSQTQSSTPLHLASLLYSSLAITSPSPQARASLIGVGIATAGNILISVALNVQKLSHQRLANEKNLSRSGLMVRNNDDGEVSGEDGSDLDEAAPPTPSPSGNTAYGGLRSSVDEPESFTSSKNRPKSKSTSIASVSNGRVELERDSSNRFTLEQDGRTSSDENLNQSSGPGSEFLRSRLWWFGICLMTLGEAGNFLSYGFAPASLVAPLGAVALLSNVVISPLLLGPQEKFSRSDFGGMLLATIGAVTVVFSSKESNARLGPDQLWEAIKRVEFFVYAGISAFFASILMLLSRTRSAERFVLIDVGVCALFGGFTVLSTKGLSSLLSARNPFDVIKYPITYLLLVILASTAVAQITYLNRALFRFDSREVIPTQFVFFTISAIVGSAILYRDFEDVEPHRFINFIFGCLTTFAGVFILTRSRGSGSHASEETQDESGSMTPSSVTTPRKRGRKKISRTSPQLGTYLQIPSRVSQELDSESDTPHAVKVNISTPITPSSEAERDDTLTPLVSTSSKSTHPGLISSMTTGSVPLSSTTSRRPKPEQHDLSGSLPTSSATPTISTSFTRNNRLSFPGPRSSPRTTPGLGFSAGHYLLLATPAAGQGLLVPLDAAHRSAPARSTSDRHVRTRSHSTPGKSRRKENQESERSQRRDREESSEGDAATARWRAPEQQKAGSTCGEESTEIGDLEMEFEQDQATRE